MSMSKSKEANVPVLSDEYTSRSIRYPLITDEMNRLLGEVLTIIDASIVSANQNKSIKDLIRSRFGELMHQRFWDYCYRSEFQYGYDSYLLQNIVDGKLKHSDQVNAVGRGMSNPSPII